jgi:hypothetical protein
LNVPADIPGEPILIDKGRGKAAGARILIENLDPDFANFSQPVSGAQTGWARAENDYRIVSETIHNLPGA